MPVTRPPKWEEIKGKPNTVAGYGITDMESQTVGAVPWSGVTGKPTTVAGLGLSDFAAKSIEAQAGAAAGAVGTYAWLNTLSAVTMQAGQTLAGTQLQYAPNTSGTSSPAGNWRLMGNLSSSPGPAVWIRIS